MSNRSEIPALRCSHTPTNSRGRGGRCRQRQSESKRQFWRPHGQFVCGNVAYLGGCSSKCEDSMDMSFSVESTYVAGCTYWILSLNVLAIFRHTYIQLVGAWHIYPAILPFAANTNKVNANSSANGIDNGISTTTSLEQLPPARCECVPSATGNA